MAIALGATNRQNVLARDGDEATFDKRGIHSVHDDEVSLCRASD